MFGRHGRHHKRHFEGGFEHGEDFPRRGPFGHGPFGRGGFGEGFGRGPRGGRGEGPFGRGRLFDHGDLKLVILALIAEQPRHGYEIIKEIEARAGGAYSPSPGVVYPTLTMLDDLGYITIEAGAGNKKLSQITPTGVAYLDANRADVEVILARLAKAGSMAGGGPSPQVIRGLENLKLALRLKLTAGALSPEQAQAIAAALDEAAQRIERA